MFFACPSCARTLQAGYVCCPFCGAHLAPPAPPPCDRGAWATPRWTPPLGARAIVAIAAVWLLFLLIAYWPTRHAAVTRSPVPAPVPAPVAADPLPYDPKAALANDKAGPVLDSEAKPIPGYTYPGVDQGTASATATLTPAPTEPVAPTTDDSQPYGYQHAPYSGGGDIYVRPYTRRDGTRVRGHYRRRHR